MSHMTPSSKQIFTKRFYYRKKSGVPVPKWQRLLEMILFLFVFSIVLWVTATLSNRYALGLVSERGQQRLDLYATSLKSSLEKYDYLPEMLSVEPKLLELLKDPKNTNKLKLVNGLLARMNRTSGTLTTYLMDGKGLTLASSNWQAERSFVGRNFHFRPYFKTAMTGGTGRYFAHGITSQQPGYFISYPVKAEAKIIGVVVVKVGVEDLEQSWALTRPNNRVIVTDEHGVIFITSQKEWKYKSLYPIAEEIRSQVIKSRQYDDAQLDHLSVQISEKTSEGNPILIIPELGDFSENRIGQFLVQSSGFSGTDWTIHFLSNLDSRRPIVSVALLVVGSVFGIIFVIILYLYQRRQVMHERWLSEQREQAALKMARDELEENVHQRTQDLTLSNNELRLQITERRKVENELRTMQSELVQSSKLAALGRMSAGVTHELNQPMTAIRSYAENAAALIGMDRVEEASANLKIISELTDRIGRITGQLKMFARKPVTNIKPVSLTNALDNSLMQTMSRIRQDKIEIRKTMPDTPVWVMGGSLRLEQILINLISNALDAMSEVDDKIKRVLEIQIHTSQDEVSLKLCDTGPGIDKDLQSKIFDPFFTTKATGQGLGLGLSITLGLVNELGGQITADNIPGGGACFKVTLQGAVKEKELNVGK
ncbi:MAG: sensor histidine kinase [Sneathiella sp.]|nr:sensor histidine kinase [Sneathiella sp.]